jgi:hypothetical protein
METLMYLLAAELEYSESSIMLLLLEIIVVSDQELCLNPPLINLLAAICSAQTIMPIVKDNGNQ